jgi:hypothetical protein
MNISAATLFPGLDGYARSQKLHIQSAQLTLQERRDFQGRWLDIFKSIRDRRKAGQERQRMDGSREEG